MLKDTLQQLDTPIAQALPSGAIQELAKKHGYTRQTIAKMLMGEGGAEESVREVLKSVREILEQTSRLQTDTARKIDQFLNAEKCAA